MARSLRSLAMVLGLGISLLNPAAAAQSATLRWFGHAFFLITSSQGVRVALDPFGDIGYPVPEVAADVVTVSHEHGDHNNPDLLTGAPVVLRGLMAGGADWNAIDHRTKDVRISALPAYHDDVRGRSRGLNSIFIVEIGGLRLAHLSDIGHTLSAETLEDMGRIDILLYQRALIRTHTPFSVPDGHDLPRLLDELVPGIATYGDNLIFRLEDAVAEPVVAHELPDVFHGVQFGRPWRQGQKRDIGRDHKLSRGMPSGLIEHEDGMCVRRYLG